MNLADAAAQGQLMTLACPCTWHLPSVRCYTCSEHITGLTYLLKAKPGDLSNLIALVRYAYLDMGHLEILSRSDYRCLREWVRSFAGFGGEDGGGLHRPGSPRPHHPAMSPSLVHHNDAMILSPTRRLSSGASGPRGPQPPSSSPQA